MRINNFKIVVLLLLGLVGYTSPAFAEENVLSFDAGNIAPGTTGTILLNLENTEPCYGFQTDLQLPDGLTMVEVAKTDRTEGAVITSNKNPGSEKIVLVSMSNALAGNNGAVCSVTFKASETFTGGKITLSNGKMSNGSMTDVVLPSSTTYIGGIGMVSVWMEDFQIYSGETKSVGVNLTNSSPLSAVQMDIYLPAGLSVDLNSFSTTTRTTGFMVEKKETDDYVRVLLYSLDGLKISGTSGSVLTFDVKAADDAEGEKSIYLKNISVSDPMALSIKVDDSETKVDIERPHVSSITLTPENVTLRVGETAQFSATVLPANALNTEVTWSVQDTGIATVDNSGLVTAVGVGKTILKAVSVDNSEIIATAEITVEATPVGEVVIDFESMGLTGNNLIMLVGDVKAIKTNVYPETATVKTLD